MKVLESQNNRCAICQIDLSTREPRDICQDHDHSSGMLRGVLCRNCNGIEGKIFNLARRGQRDATPIWFLDRLVEYLKHFKANPSGVMHPLHKTIDEKRDYRNAKARAKYKAKRK